MRHFYLYETNPENNNNNNKKKLVNNRTSYPYHFLTPSNAVTKGSATAML